jgi:hypothetical protein
MGVTPVLVAGAHLLLAGQALHAMCFATIWCSCWLLILYFYGAEEGMLLPFGWRLL